MTANASNVALIGMPGAGKSTLGVLLAKRKAHGFVDVDLLIQEAEEGHLREIIAKRGVAEFRRIEERCVLALECSNYVIATGGSVVYCARAMAHLQAIATVVYLEVSLPVLRERLCGPDGPGGSDRPGGSGGLDARGVIYAPGQDLDSLFAERHPLYERWADLRVECGDLGHDAAVALILARLAER